MKKIEKNFVLSHKTLSADTVVMRPPNTSLGISFWFAPSSVLMQFERLSQFGAPFFSGKSIWCLKN